MLKILGIAALMTLFVGTAPKAMANDEATAPAMEELMSSEDPAARHDDDWRRPGRGSFVCYARNVTGRTFAAWGNWRTPPRWVQMRALEQCRRNSGFFRFTCRNIGCRRVGWR